MRVEHLAIDGSVVAIEAEADLSGEATATGWAIVPSLMRTYPFAVFPAGHSLVVERAIRGSEFDVKVRSIEEFSVKGGRLRVGIVELPTATGGRRSLSVGAWEGRTGCLTTSLRGAVRDELVEVFDTLQFSEGRRGLAVDSPVTSQPRVPEVIKEVAELGVVSVRPVTSTELEHVPRARGAATRHGELFRLRAGRDALLFLSSSAVVRVDPLPGADADRMMGVAETLMVEWSPRATVGRG